MYLDSKGIVSIEPLSNDIITHEKHHIFQYALRISFKDAFVSSDNTFAISSPIDEVLDCIVPYSGSIFGDNGMNYPDIVGSVHRIDVFCQEGILVRTKLKTFENHILDVGFIKGDFFSTSKRGAFFCLEFKENKGSLWCENRNNKSLPEPNLNFINRFCRVEYSIRQEIEIPPPPPPQVAATSLQKPISAVPKKQNIQYQKDQRPLLPPPHLKIQTQMPKQNLQPQSKHIHPQPPKQNLQPQPQMQQQQKHLVIQQGKPFLMTGQLQPQPQPQSQQIQTSQGTYIQNSGPQFQIQMQPQITLVGQPLQQMPYYPNFWQSSQQQQQQQPQQQQQQPQQQIQPQQAITMIPMGTYTINPQPMQRNIQSVPIQNYQFNNGGLK